MSTRRCRPASVLSVLTSSARVRRSPAATHALHQRNSSSRGSPQQAAGSEWAATVRSGLKQAPPQAHLAGGGAAHSRRLAGYRLGSHSRYCCRVGMHKPGLPARCSACSCASVKSCAVSSWKGVPVATSSFAAVPALAPSVGKAADSRASWNTISCGRDTGGGPGQAQTISWARHIRWREERQPRHGHPASPARDSGGPHLAVRRLLHIKLQVGEGWQRALEAVPVQQRRRRLGDVLHQRTCAHRNRHQILGRHYQPALRVPWHWHSCALQEHLEHLGSRVRRRGALLRRPAGCRPAKPGRRQLQGAWRMLLPPPCAAVRQRPPPGWRPRAAAPPAGPCRRQTASTSVAGTQAPAATAPRPALSGARIAPACGRGVSRGGTGK